MHLANGVYRYLVSGTYATGPVTVTFAAGKITDSKGYTNAASTETFTVLGPTAALADPASNSTASPNTLEPRGLPRRRVHRPAGKTIDPSTITDAGRRVHALRHRHGGLVDRHHEGADPRQHEREHVGLPLLDDRRLHERHRLDHVHH